jgi:hypothetical protein
MSRSIGPKTLIPMEVPEGRQGERVTPTRRSREPIYCGRGMDDSPISPEQPRRRPERRQSRLSFRPAAGSRASRPLD